MEKTFENWLVVSDIDGTLNTKRRKLPQNNYDAIKKFTELGGHFTLASGRMVSSLNRHYSKICANEPAIVINGGGIYDFKKKEMIYRSELAKLGQEFTHFVLKKFPLMEVGIFFDDFAYIVRAGVASMGQKHVENVDYKRAKIKDVPTTGWTKVVFWANPLYINILKRYAETHFTGEQLTFMKTSAWSYEMLAGNTNKGTTVMKLAKMLGIEKSHVAAIGDYYNDLDMLKTVGYPACTAEAPKIMHKLSKFEACSCNDGSVADLINHIMNLK